MSALSKQQMNAEIDAEHFSSLEWKGFQVNPRLALMAGIAIGMRLALDDVLKRFESRFAPELEQEVLP